MFKKGEYVAIAASGGKGKDFDLLEQVFFSIYFDLNHLIVHYIQCLVCIALEFTIKFNKYPDIYGFCVFTPNFKNPGILHH